MAHRTSGTPDDGYGTQQVWSQEDFLRIMNNISLVITQQEAKKRKIFSCIMSKIATLHHDEHTSNTCSFSHALPAASHPLPAATHPLPAVNPLPAASSPARSQTATTTMPHIARTDQEPPRVSPRVSPCRLLSGPLPPVSTSKDPSTEVAPLSIQETAIAAKPCVRLLQEANPVQEHSAYQSTVRQPRLTRGQQRGAEEGDEEWCQQESSDTEDELQPPPLSAERKPTFKDEASYDSTVNAAGDAQPITKSKRTTPKNQLKDKTMALNGVDIDRESLLAALIRHRARPEATRIINLVVCDTLGEAAVKRLRKIIRDSNIRARDSLEPVPLPSEYRAVESLKKYHLLVLKARLHQKAIMDVDDFNYKLTTCHNSIEIFKLLTTVEELIDTGEPHLTRFLTEAKQKLEAKRIDEEGDKMGQTQQKQKRSGKHNKEILKAVVGEQIGWSDKQWKWYKNNVSVLMVLMNRYGMGLMTIFPRVTRLTAFGSAETLEEVLDVIDDHIPDLKVFCREIETLVVAPWKELRAIPADLGGTSEHPQLMDFVRTQNASAISSTPAHHTQVDAIKEAMVVEQRSLGIYDLTENVKTLQRGMASSVFNDDNVYGSTQPSSQGASAASQPSRQRNDAGPMESTASVNLQALTLYTKQKKDGEEVASENLSRQSRSSRSKKQGDTHQATHSNGMSQQSTSSGSKRRDDEREPSTQLSKLATQKGFQKEKRAETSERAVPNGTSETSTPCSSDSRATRPPSAKHHSSRAALPEEHASSQRSGRSVRRKDGPPRVPPPETLEETDGELEIVDAIMPNPRKRPRSGEKPQGILKLLHPQDASSRPLKRAARSIDGDNPECHTTVSRNPNPDKEMHDRRFAQSDDGRSSKAGLEPALHKSTESPFPNNEQPAPPTFSHGEPESLQISTDVQDLNAHLDSTPDHPSQHSVGRDPSQDCQQEFGGPPSSFQQTSASSANLSSPSSVSSAPPVTEAPSLRASPSSTPVELELAEKTPVTEGTYSSPNLRPSGTSNPVVVAAKLGSQRSSSISLDPSQNTE